MPAWCAITSKTQRMQPKLCDPTTTTRTTVANKSCHGTLIAGTHVYSTTRYFTIHDCLSTQRNLVWYIHLWSTKLVNLAGVSLSSLCITRTIMKCSRRECNVIRHDSVEASRYVFKHHHPHKTAICLMQIRHDTIVFDVNQKSSFANKQRRRPNAKTETFRATVNCRRENLTVQSKWMDSDTQTHPTVVDCILTHESCLEAHPSFDSNQSCFGKTQWMRDKNKSCDAITDQEKVTPIVTSNIK